MDGPVSQKYWDTLLDCEEVGMYAVQVGDRARDCLREFERAGECGALPDDETGAERYGRILQFLRGIVRFSETSEEVRRVMKRLNEKEEMED